MHRYPTNSTHFESQYMAPLGDRIFREACEPTNPCTFTKIPVQPVRVNQPTWFLPAWFPFPDVAANNI